MIIIAGDSWGCGEWNDSIIPSEHRIEHQGLGRYLCDIGHDVINISYRGGSNVQSHRNLSWLLEQSPDLYQKVTRIFVFQTEWIRDWELDIDYSSLSEYRLGWNDLKFSRISSFYYSLSELSQKYDITIYLIGGWSDTVWLDQFEQEYPGVKIACQSMVNLLTANDHRIDQPCFQGVGNDWWTQKIVGGVKKYCTDRDLEIFLQDCELAESRQVLLSRRKDLFWPDGKHANRHGYKILFDYLLEQNII